MNNRQRGARQGVERWRERSEAVEAGLEPHLVPLWRRIRDGVKGSNCDERLTKFNEYVEAHPDEALAALERAAEQKLDALLRDRRRDDRRVSDFVDAFKAESEDVPF